MKKYFFYIIFIIFIMPSLGICKNALDDEFIYNDHNKRNPFFELIDSKGNVINYGGDIMVTDMFLEGVMLGAQGNNVAIINGKVVKKNDKIGDFTVFEIKSDTVVLIKDSKRFELRLKKEE